MPRSVPRLPRNPNDGDEVLDKYGNRWRYEIADDTWISLGVVSSPPIVTETQDGLVPPDVFDKLQKIKQLVDSGYDLSPFKLLPGLDAYWYLFRSSDKCYRFIPEAENVLRIEVDKAKLYSLFSRDVCKGDRGARGETGAKGDDGNSAPRELCYLPIIDGPRLDFSIHAPAVLTLDGDVFLPNDHIPDISIRLYRFTGDLEAASAVAQLDYLPVYYHRFKSLAKQVEAIRKREAETGPICGPLSQVLDTIGLDVSITPIPVLEILVDPTGTEEIRVGASSLRIDTKQTIDSIKYDPDLGIICGSIVLLGDNWEGSWCVKARQRGPDGLPGLDGECRFNISNCVVDNTNIVATCPIVNVRVDCNSNTIFTHCTNLINEVCVRTLTFLPDSGTIVDRDVFKSTFAAVQMTLDECKHLDRYKIELEDEDLPELELQHWDPQPGCFTKRNYNRHLFNWIPATNVDPCTPLATWYGPLTVRRGKYPWPIELPNVPPDDQCCEEPAFFCPNIQEGVQGKCDVAEGN